MNSSDLPSGSSALEQRLAEASQLAESGQWDEAFRILTEEEREYPTDATLLCMLGVVAEQVGASGLSYDYYRRCLAEQPHDPLLLVTLGVALARYDDPEAEGVLRLAALSAPELAAARLQYGAYLAREGMYELAVEELRVARQLDADDPQIGRELGAAHLLAGRVEEGVDELEQAVGAAVEDDELHLLYGLALLQARRGEEAAEELHRAAAALPHDGEAQLVAALACASQEWWDEAWDALARADVAVIPPDSGLAREVEETLEAGAAAAEALLLEQIAPPLLRERLMERP